ncbi:MAG: phosphate/phosphite/phosphonate ABC transporter substrate-binding protein [Pirellulales bacterium]
MMTNGSGASQSEHNVDSPRSQANPPHRPVSYLRVALVVVPIGLLLLGATIAMQQQFRRDANAIERRVNNRIFNLASAAEHRLAPKFNDHDGNLVADPPTVAAKQVRPDTLVFSYISGDDAERQGKVWQPLVDAIGKATGLPVEYVAFDDQQEQLTAMQEGRLHVVGLNTGTVPTAVNTCGFVPVCTLGRADGSYGYTMQIIVPADSAIKNIDDLRGERITFTSPTSNSGFRAPVVILMSDFGLHPIRDYGYGFSTSHAESVRRIVAGQVKVAPVASDMLDRTVALDGLDASKFRAIYESERFPPAALGYVYNLAPDIAEKIAALLPGFQFVGTSLEEEFAPSGVTQLVPVSYKDNWAVVRRIDDALAHVQDLTGEGSPATGN